MSHSISAVESSWTTTPLTRVWICLSRKSQSVTRPGPIGREGVRALDAQHRAGVGVAEVVQAVVVADGVAGDVVARLLGRDVAAGAADDDDDLALVVEPLAALGPDDRALVAVERRDRLVEVRRRRRELRHELLRAASRS
jgi:hypothetical protein